MEHGPFFVTDQLNLKPRSTAWSLPYNILVPIIYYFDGRSLSRLYTKQSSVVILFRQIEIVLKDSIAFIHQNQVT